MASRWARVGPHVRRRRAENPGPMTLDGTNSFVLGAPGAGVVVVDPGPLQERHLAELADSGTVELILITHRHGDHTDGSARLHELTGAPVRAFAEEFCHGGVPVADGELIRAGGLTIEVLATPGHTSDSLCFAVETAPGERVMATGDTILGSGSTVLDYPDGTLADYLQSLERLCLRGTNNPTLVLPGHGPVLPDLAAAARDYQQHRHERLAQVRAAVEHLAINGNAMPAAHEVAALVYGHVPAELQRAAALSVQAQLEFLRR